MRKALSEPRGVLVCGLACLALVPLAYSGSLHYPFVLPKALLLCFGVLLATGGTLVCAAKAGWRWARTPLDAPLAAALACLALSTLTSQDRCSSAFGHFALPGFGLWLMSACAAACWLAAAARPTQPERKLLLAIVLAAAALASAHAFFQFLGAQPIAVFSASPAGRPGGLLGIPVALGGYLCMALPLALHWALSAEDSPFAGWAAAACIGAGLFANATRGAWLGAACGIALCLALSRRSWPAWSRRRALLTAAAVLLLLAALSWRIGARAINSSHGNDWLRRATWTAAWRSFQENPLLGSGPSTFELSFRRLRSDAFSRATMGHSQIHAHNDLLEALATTGVAGTAAYAYLVLILATAAARSWRGGDKWAPGLAGSLCALFVHMKFNPITLSEQATAALLAGLLAGSAPPERERSGAAAVAGLWALTAAAAVSAALSLRFLAAGAAETDGMRLAANGWRAEARAKLEQAVRLNSCSMPYGQRLTQALLQDAMTAPGGLERSRLLDAAEAAARENRRLHPNDAWTRFLLGRALFTQTVEKPQALAEARTELELAAAENPNSQVILETARDAARAAGDRARIEEIEARLKALRREPGP